MRAKLEEITIGQFDSYIESYKKNRFVSDVLSSFIDKYNQFKGQGSTDCYDIVLDKHYWIKEVLLYMVSCSCAKENDIERFIEESSQELGVEKKFMVNLVAYYFAMKHLPDFKLGFKTLLELYPDLINFEETIDFGNRSTWERFGNNIIKGLIYNENWNSLDCILDYFCNNPGKYSGSHLDKDKKSDLAALLINFAPPNIIKKYVEVIGLENIDIFALDKKWRSVFSLMVACGRDDVWEVFSNDISSQDMQIIEREYLKGLEMDLEKFLLNNGGGYSCGRNIIKCEDVKKPLDRTCEFDVGMRYVLSSIENFVLFQGKKHNIATLQEGQQDKQVHSDLTQQGGSLRDILLTRGNEMLKDQRYDRLKVEGVMKTITNCMEYNLPDKAAIDFFPQEWHGKTRKKLVEEGKEKIGQFYQNIERNAPRGTGWADYITPAFAVGGFCVIASAVVAYVHNKTGEEIGR